MDRTVKWCLSGLLLATPLAVGGVEPWAYAPLEALVFLLCGAWMARGIVDPGALAQQSRAATLAKMILPAALLLAAIGVELAPLPPALLRAASPQTCNLYFRSLPGWPAAPPAVHSIEDQRPAPGMVTLPTADEVAAGALAPFEPAVGQGRAATSTKISTAKSTINVWRTLSISPSLTAPALLKLICYAAFFVLVAAYPLDELRQGPLSEHLSRTFVATGLIASTIAILEWVVPNGRALWLFQPYDWPKGQLIPWGGRAVGSFANPDHLADFLDQTLPFALVGAIRPAALSLRRSKTIRTFSIVAITTILSALLLSSSRGGWLGALIGMTALAALWPRRAGAGRLQASSWIAAGAALAFALVLLLLLVGPRGRLQVDARLKQTVSDESLAGREAPAKASLAMIEDFPLFGVGLGCWPEIFPHYNPPPWTPTFWNATHNDYVQLASETGLIGFALLAWFGVAVGRGIRAGYGSLKPDQRLLVGAAAAGVAAVAIHEFFDFSLQIPANALLCAGLLGVAVRLTSAPQHHAETRSGRRARWLYGLGFAAALGLTAAALAQPRIPYPYNLRRPRRVGDAYALVNAYPANAKTHFALAGLLAGPAASAERTAELRAAVWLAPTNPLFRDSYAHALLENREKTDGLAQIVKSVSFAPNLDEHFYLRPRILPWLPQPARAAVRQGFVFAVDHRYPGAVDQFARYYQALGDEESEAALFDDAGRSEPDGSRREYYFDRAGNVYAQIGNFTRAQGDFDAAIEATPANPEPYADLIANVFAREKRWDAGAALIAQAEAHGVDPFRLYLALAAGAQAAGDYDVARSALRHAEDERPGSYAAARRLGFLELAANRPDQGAKWLQRAAQLEPDSPAAFAELARAQASAYDYFAADQAYRRALAIAPNDASLKREYADFRERVAQNSDNHK